jgi:hypothetical protein
LSNIERGGSQFIRGKVEKFVEKMAGPLIMDLRKPFIARLVRMPTPKRSLLRAKILQLRGLVLSLYFEQPKAHCN